MKLGSLIQSHQKAQRKYNKLLSIIICQRKLSNQSFLLTIIIKNVLYFSIMQKSINALLEICCYSPSAALVAQSAGAHRIELCDNPGEGGTTPSYGILKWIRENILIPVFPIIRPRGGHFVFSEDEFAIMAEDISVCKTLGFEGVVIGQLTANADVDYDQTAQLTEIAWPMEVTFHRAFDRVRDPMASLETIIKAGCQRILTSGQKPIAPEGAKLLSELVKAAENNIIIMPGSGVRSSNIIELAKETGAVEFHSSASIKIPEAYYTPPGMEEHLDQVLPDPKEIKSLLEMLNRL